MARLAHLPLPPPGVLPLAAGVVLPSADAEPRTAPATA
jgi:hypothetical protein